MPCESTIILSFSAEPDTQWRDRCQACPECEWEEAAAHGCTVYQKYPCFRTDCPAEIYGERMLHTWRLLTETNIGPLVDVGDDPFQTCELSDGEGGCVNPELDCNLDTEPRLSDADLEELGIDLAEMYELENKREL